MMKTYGIFLRVADFHPENVIQQPVNRLLLVEHKYEFHYEVQIRSLKHLTYKKAGAFTNQLKAFSQTFKFYSFYVFGSVKVLRTS